MVFFSAKNTVVHSESNKKYKACFSMTQSARAVIEHLYSDDQLHINWACARLTRLGMCCLTQEGGGNADFFQEKPRRKARRTASKPRGSCREEGKKEKDREQKDVRGEEEEERE